MSREMELLKHAIATGSNYTKILQLDQQQAMTDQEQSQGMRGDNQNTAMTFPGSSGDFTTQGMDFNLDISKFNNSGNLVKSYENTPPGIQSLSMGEGEGTVIETPSDYQKGGFKSKYQKGGVKKEEEFPGLLPEVEVSALTDESYNKLNSPQKQIYDTFKTPRGIAQTVNIGEDREMHWKDALKMTKDLGIRNISNKNSWLFQKLFERYPKLAKKGTITPHANSLMRTVTIPEHKGLGHPEQNKFLQGQIDDIKENKKHWIKEKFPTKQERKDRIKALEGVQENFERSQYFDNLIAEYAHIPEFWRTESFKNLPVSAARDIYRFVTGQEIDHSRYKDPQHTEYHTHTGPDSFEEKLRSKYEIKQKGGFNKYQTEGFTIKREEGDEHIRDVDISGVDFNLLYDAIEQHEHRGAIDVKNYDSFIRTKSKKGEGSSAYGPIQLTHGKLLDLTTPGKRAYYDVENVDPTFHNIMVQQGSDMLEFGGSDMPKEGVTEDGRDVSMYDYGQSGVVGNTTRDREKYKRMGIQILEGDYRFSVKNPKKDVNTLHQMLKAYGTGTNKYAKDVLKIYNELKEVDALPTQKEFKF